MSTLLQKRFLLRGLLILLRGLKSAETCIRSSWQVVPPPGLNQFQPLVAGGFRTESRFFWFSVLLFLLLMMLMMIIMTMFVTSLQWTWWWRLRFLFTMLQVLVACCGNKKPPPERIIPYCLGLSAKASPGARGFSKTRTYLDSLL